MIRRGRGGFTLIEVMLVLAILVALAGAGIGAYMYVQANSDKKLAKVTVSEVANAINRYKIDVGSYPEAGEAGIQALLTKPSDEKLAAKWGGPYLNGAAPNDPWNNPIVYDLATDENGNQVPHVSSNGPDGSAGTDDDIKSWTEAK
jgi:general secretion pathway protein G